MSAGATRGVIGLVIGVVLGALLVLALPGPVMAQQALPSAELKRVVGRVEVLSKGQTQWIPAVVGARLAEGDDIRAYSGAIGRADAARHEHGRGGREQPASPDEDGI